VSDRIVVLIFPLTAALQEGFRMEKETLDKVSAFIAENKGSRKFTQSVELAINFTGIDMSKQVNRLNMDVKLPNGKGKAQKVMVFADDKTMVAKATSAGAQIVSGTEMQSMANDKVKLASLLNYEMLAQPSLMPQIAKALGQFLGPRNKMPKPLIGQEVDKAVNDITKSIYIRSKGKYLPTVHCIVGNESMTVDMIAANIDEVLGAVVKKVGKPHIKSVFMKLTMSKPIKIM
jgi:large subunit ribosomal protein L1